MISIYQKIQKVETLQRQIDMSVAKFKSCAGIDCLSHCSECCSYPEILATPLEFLPFAYHAMKLGLIDQWAEELENWKKPTCFFRKQTENTWGCRIYPVRGLICRLFGFSATFDKQGQPVFAACRVLKKAIPDKVEQIRIAKSLPGRIPVIANHYRRLASIDINLGQEFLPINEAIKKAIEIAYFKLIFRHQA